MILIIFLIILIIYVIIKIYYLYFDNTPYNTTYNTMDLFKLSNNQKILKISDEIFIVDNFYKYPDKIRQYAINNKHNFKNNKALYKRNYYNPEMYYDQHYELINFLNKICNINISKDSWNNDTLTNTNGYLQFITINSNPVIHKDEHWSIVLFLTPDARYVIVSKTY